MTVSNGSAEKTVVKRASRRLELLVLVAMLVAAAWLRFDDLDRFIASDEVRWTCRSINFASGLTEGDLERTFQVGHPGVVTMWLGAVALPRDQVGEWWRLAQHTEGCTEMSELDDTRNQDTYATIGPILFAARRGVAAATLVLLALVYGAARVAGVGPVAGLLGLGLLAFDPFLLAHSRVLHLDAVTSLLAVLSVVLLAAHTAQGSPRSVVRAAAPLVLSGAVGGLAMVEKSSALVLLPFAGLWLVLAEARAGGLGAARLEEIGAKTAGARGLPDVGAALASAAKQIFVWLTGAALAAFAAWPSLWVSPLGTVARVISKAAEEGGSPHAGGNFFMGRPVDDPGILFYPVAVLFRLTPIGTVAVAAACVLAAVAIRSYLARASDTSQAEREAAAAQHVGQALVLWAAVFVAAVTLGPKKFDRYALPAMAALVYAGGPALVAAAAFVGGRSEGRRRLRGRLTGGRQVGPLTAVLAGVAVLLQLIAAGRSLPYSLAYYNPLLGGAPMAARVLLVGWGEGYDLAAEWLNQQPDVERIEASVPGVSNFLPLFEGVTRSAPGYRAGRTDYAVLYISKAQRERYENVFDRLHQTGEVEPVFTGTIAGVPYVWIYENHTIERLRDVLDAEVEPGDVIVADGESAFARLYQRRNLLLKTWGHWSAEDFLASAETELPPDWSTVWVIRYPEYEPDAAFRAMESLGTPDETESLFGGVIELTRFTRAR